MFLKIFCFIILILYQTNLYSKAANEKEFNQKYLSNYLSALLSFDNQKNNDALKFFESSKLLIQSHDNFLQEYIFSLLLDGQVKKAINQLKYSNNSIGGDFFEGNLLLILDSLNKKKFKMIGSTNCTFCHRQLSELNLDWDTKILNIIDCANKPEICSQNPAITGFPSWVSGNGKVYSGFKTVPQLEKIIEEN